MTVRSKKNYVEDNNLIAYFDWVRVMRSQNVLYNWIFHVPNEGYRSNGARAKAKGMTKGIPDVMAPIKNKAQGFIGFALEFKSETGRISPEQTAWLDFLTLQGWHCGIARSAQGAQNFTENYIKSASL